MTVQAVDITNINRALALSSQDDAEFTNDTGAALTQGNCYLAGSNFWVVPYAEAPADGATFAALIRAEVANLKKATGALSRGQVLYYNPAAGNFDTKPRLYLPTPATFDMTADDTILVSVNGGSAQTVTVATGDVVSIDAVTAAELIAVLSSDITGATGKSFTGLDGETYVYIEHDAGGAGASLRITGGTGTGLTATGLAIGMIAIPQAKAYADAESSDETVPGAFDGQSGAQWAVQGLAVASFASSGRVVNIPLTSFLKENLVTELGTAGDATNLGLVSGTHGSASPTLQGSDFGGTSATETVRTLIQIPLDYQAGSNLTLGIKAGMLTTVSGTSATLDVEAYEPDGAAGVGSDICATAAQSINSLTPAVKSFVITGTNLAPGDVIDVQLTIAGVDSGDAGVMKGFIGNVALSY